MFTEIRGCVDPSIAAYPDIVTQGIQLSQDCWSFPDLTSIIQTLENFQDFEPEIKLAAIALYASDLGIPQMHFYAIAIHAGLGGAR